MKLTDEFKRDKETVKRLSGKEKVRYIWTYYKWYIIIPIVLIVMIGSVIYHAVVDPDVALNGVVLNAFGTDSEQPVNDFIEEYIADQGMDAKKETVALDISFQFVPNDESGVQNYEVIQGLGAWIKNESVDFVTADKESMVELTEATYFMDLGDVLTAEQLEKYSSKIISVDGVPLLLDVSESEKLANVYLEQYGEMAIGVAKGAPNMEEVRDFIDYLMNN